MEITKGENANLAGMEPRCPRELGVDISNLRFYSAMAHDFKWQTDVIHWSVISDTLKEIAERLASPAPTPPLDVEAEKRIAEIRERESKATKGPWYVQHELNVMAPDPRGGHLSPFSNSSLPHDERITNIEFSAHSRQDIPFLLEQRDFLLEQISLLRRHIASPAQPEKAKGCPECSNPLIPMLACSDFKNCSSLWHVDDPRITNTPRPIEPEPTPASKTEIDSFAEHLATGISGFNNFKGKAGIIDWIRYQAEAWKAAQPLPAPPQSGKEGQ